MAKKSKSSKPDFQIRRVRTLEDRKRPSVFTRLKVDESFKGTALFEPNPELDDNPGYFEYYDHYDKQGNTYVPCAGDKCPFCAANDNPSTRALTAWHFPDADKKDQIKLFTMNFSTVNETADEAEENDGLMGKTVRIKRMSDKGDYKVRVLPGKGIAKRDLEKLKKQLDEMFPEGLEGVIMRSLRVQMERLKALEALDDDDDEEEAETPKARRGRAVVEENDDDEDEEEEEDEDEEDEEEDEDEEDEDEEEDEEEEEEEDDEEEAAEISGIYEVVKVQENEEIFDLKNDDGKVKMWVGSGVDVDYDEIKKGVQVNVSAAQDDEGDWIITEISLAQAKSGKGKSKAKK